MNKKGLLARVIAAVLALALAGLAAWLWLRPPPAPHGEIDAADREALRGILRDAEAP